MRVVAFVDVVTALVLVAFVVVAFADVVTAFVVLTGAADDTALPAAQVGNVASLPWSPPQLALVVSFSLSPSPLLTPLYSLHTFLVVPHDPLILAVSPKLLLIPTRSEVMP